MMMMMMMMMISIQTFEREITDTGAVHQPPPVADGAGQQAL